MDCHDVKQIGPFILPLGNILMERSDSEKDSRLAFPDVESANSSRRVKGRIVLGVTNRLLHGIYIPRLGRGEGKMEFHDRFSILKQEHGYNFHSAVIYCHEILGKRVRDC